MCLLSLNLLTWTSLFFQVVHNPISWKTFSDYSVGFLTIFDNLASCILLFVPRAQELKIVCSRTGGIHGNLWSEDWWFGSRWVVSVLWKLWKEVSLCLSLPIALRASETYRGLSSSLSFFPTLWGLGWLVMRGHNWAMSVALWITNC